MIQLVSVALERLVHYQEPKGLISVSSEDSQMIHKSLSDSSGAKEERINGAIREVKLALCNGCSSFAL